MVIWTHVGMVVKWNMMVRGKSHSTDAHLIVGRKQQEMETEKLKKMERWIRERAKER